ncbi:MAG TPA: DUF488 family protein [Chitinophagaceae bacterium]|nr:DUF488 family protein [Chitinophagaceae bacterium]
MAIRIKRAYQPASSRDGYRVLVDRVWPRGLSRDSLRIDRWLREVAPSDALRRWFGHDPARWEAFREKYRSELQHNPAWEELRALAGSHKTLTLVFGARDTEHNQAVVLAEMLC